MNVLVNVFCTNDLNLNNSACSKLMYYAITLFRFSLAV